MRTRGSLGLLLIALGCSSTSTEGGGAATGGLSAGGTGSPTGGVSGSSGGTGGGKATSGGSAAGGDSAGGSATGGNSTGGSPASTGGAASGLVDCDLRKVVCKIVVPNCPEGQVPSVNGTCYGPCTKIESCACAAAEECPDHDRYTCWGGKHCGPYVD